MPPADNKIAEEASSECYSPNDQNTKDFVK